MQKKQIARQLLIMIYISLIALNAPINAQTPKISLTYLYAGTTSLYTNYVDRAGGAIRIVCPDYFELYDTGDLKIMPKASTQLVDAMHERSIKVTPFLTNHWNRTLGRAALQNRVSLVAQIVSAINQYGFDGINIDIENLTEADRNLHTDFIRLLRESLPPGKTISLAMAANPFGVYYGWAGSYDYQALGELCDYVMIMAYDEHFYGSPEGPVASSGFVENSLQYAVKMIPKEKVLLGMPFYGRYWKSGSATGGWGITSYDVDSLINRYGGKVAYDLSTQTAKVAVTIKDTDPKPVLWGGKVLGAGTYTIYYDNEQALKYKLSLVQKYDILGAGSWCLGQESLKTWEYYERWLNGKYFTDILGHYAQDDILAVSGKGWMIGVSTTSFAPNRTLTRAEAAIILVRVLGLENELPAEPFSDTKTHWARDMIGIAKKYQILLGDGSNRFWPGSPLTREQMAMILDRILVLPNPATGNPFSDINPVANPLSYEAILKLAANGIVKVSPTGSFLPQGTVRRGEMAAFISRASAYEMIYPAMKDPKIISPRNIVEPR